MTEPVVTEVPEAVADFVRWVEVAANHAVDRVIGATDEGGEQDFVLLIRTRWPEGSGKETGWLVERNFPDYNALAEMLDDAAREVRNWPNNPKHRARVLGIGEPTEEAGR